MIELLGPLLLVYLKQVDCVDFARYEEMDHHMRFWYLLHRQPGPEVIKLFMLNSTEHEISSAHKN